MWIVKPKVKIENAEEFEVATEREAYEFCRESGGKYYYEFLSQSDYMKRKVRQWKNERKQH